MNTLSHDRDKIKLSEGASDPKGMPKLMKESTAKNKDKSNEGSNPTNRNIVIVRHGSTKLNSDKVEKLRGWLDVPLDEKGVKEATAVGKRLKGLIDVIIASDLKRTQETAKHVSEHSGAPIIAFSKALRPLNLGIFTGQPKDLVLENIYDFIKRKPDEAIPDGESFHTFRDRFLKEIQEIEKKFPDKRVGIVTHHRNERMYAAWKKKGAPKDFSYDWDTFRTKGIPPGDFIIL